MHANTQSDVLTQAVEASEGIQQARRRHAFEDAVRAFTRVLRTVPDYAPHALSSDAVGGLRTLAEGVIARIEERVATARDPCGVQVDLVERVYEIRRALEEIEIWRRHYPSGT